MHEALEALEAQGHHIDALRVRAFPFGQEVYDFITAHEETFVVEQNRDAQLRTMIVTEGEIDPAKLTPVLHYDGAPITARFLIDAIGRRLSARSAVREIAE
jgi:2-oxoglutarate ferredoxin oxidoreductase subunit alpha